jgi:uncharacterized protein
MLEITQQVARRYVLGRQGIWPGRRWQGPAGVEQALRTSEAVQIDPISVVARNHFLVLWSRVADFQPDWLTDLLYTKRHFFEYGGIMFIYPVEEIPYWLPVMGRKAAWHQRTEREMSEVVEHVRQRITAEGPLGTRDFKDRLQISGGFNTIKDTSHALEYLWDTGQVLIHSRRGLDRIFELTSRMIDLAPHTPGSLEEAKEFFLAKALRDLGLASATELARRATAMLRIRIGAASSELKHILEKMLAENIICALQMEGRKETLYYPAADTPLLEELAQGRIPAAWTPLATTTNDEVNLLAPLDNIIWDRLRVKSLFDFDYIWEVYKPAATRRWGYYTLPVVYGDRFVARLDPKLDRKTNRLLLQGFWLEDPTLAEDPAFAQALAAGVQRFARFHQATSIDPTVITYPLLRTSIATTDEHH